MLRVVTFLALLKSLTPALGINRPCVPNTQFVLNGRICYCNNIGVWSEASCLSVVRRGNCTPGQIIRHGCSECICQENGQMLCSNSGCHEDLSTIQPPPKLSDKKDSLATWCTPFRSYYINCSICVCPASGKTSEAHCAIDTSCQHPQPSSPNFLIPGNKNLCIPNVMYIFPCLHCLCSDGGYFDVNKCVETCHQTQKTEAPRRCLSRTFYRKNCNVCWCPDNSVPDEQLCTKSVCNDNSKFRSLSVLKPAYTKCRPYSFLKPKCYYCGCNTLGYINENACLELECLKLDDFKYDVFKNSCSPGEMVPSCVECFCMANGITNKSYCSNTCSYQSKLGLLEQVLKDSAENKALINKDYIKASMDSELCEPNSMYLDQGRYCLCPDNGSTNFKLCTSVTDEQVTKKPSERFASKIDKALNQTCKPNTFVEIDCNTCYCGKNGRIEPRWCTYDDCNSKRIVKNSHKSRTDAIEPALNSTCVPGSVSTAECNFCICPSSGLLKDRACTKNKCSDIQSEIDDEKFTCEPLEYYLVDCNVCLCPRDGVKNVAKCTKKICEKPFLRSDNCVPGQFFSADCNVCVCPPNGDKKDKVCTDNSCSESETPWKKIFKLSQSLLDNSLTQDSNRQLDVCFSGEEFEIGCRICVCTDVGLRSYAICTDSGCEEQNMTSSNLRSSDPDLNEGGEVDHIRTRRHGEGETMCTSFNLSNSAERKECTPGSMYIIRCQQCICPYVGNINQFCRPLPRGTYCEQAFPNFNYVSMGRRNEEVNATASNSTSPAPYEPHPHTWYRCARAGRVSDACFQCECEAPALALLEEHCFRSDARACQGARPSFLHRENRTVRT